MCDRLVHPAADGRAPEMALWTVFVQASAIGGIDFWGQFRLAANTFSHVRNCKYVC